MGLNLVDARQPCRGEESRFACAAAYNHTPDAKLVRQTRSAMVGRGGTRTTRAVRCLKRVRCWPFLEPSTGIPECCIDDDASCHSLVGCRLRFEHSSGTRAWRSHISHANETIEACKRPQLSCGLALACMPASIHRNATWEISFTSIDMSSY